MPGGSRGSGRPKADERPLDDNREVTKPRKENGYGRLECIHLA